MLLAAFREVSIKMTEFPSKWICRNNKKYNPKISDNISCSRLLLELFARRNIVTEKEIISFLRPALKYMHDAMKLPGIREGINRVNKAIERNEKILIFGDYDADGVISSALMYKFLKDIGLETEVYIPDRFNEGYDLSVDFIKKIAAAGKYSLIISVDCGTNSSEVQEFVRNNETPDVIVCDHHNQAIDLDTGRKDYIIINPKLRNSQYPFKHLSGAAVTFKFIMGILRKLEDRYKKSFKKNYLTNMLDLVAISTIADIMPLIDENRVMVKKGLEILNKTENPGLKKMMEIMVKNKECIDEYDVGFIIAPRLNAAGRIKNARKSFELLVKDGDTAGKIADELNSFNEKRQKIQKNILNEIIEKNDFDKIIAEKKIFIDKSKNWNEGVLGIVASDIVKKFNIPAILFKESESKLKGSGRSIDKFDLHGSLMLCSGLFDSFGGHRLACGIRMDISNYKKFYKDFTEIANKNIKIEDIEKKNIFDAEIDFKDIRRDAISEINLLKPFGYGNPKPSFITGNCVLVDFYYLSGEKHIRLKLKQSGVIMDAIIFGADGKVKKKMIRNNKVNILYKIEENKWGNNCTIQLVIADLF
jgi:single-stranded-DNA-specific exonuclease